MDSMVRFMAFMQRSAWSRFSFGRGGLARLGALGLLALLAGCEGEVTMDLATELPADPNITQVVAYRPRAGIHHQQRRHQDPGVQRQRAD